MPFPLDWSKSHFQPINLLRRASKITDQNFVQVLVFKGQIISKRFFLAEDSSKKRTKTRRILVKTNSFVRFLEESSARKKTFRDYLTFK